MEVSLEYIGPSLTYDGVACTVYLVLHHGGWVQSLPTAKEKTVNVPARDEALGTPIAGLPQLLVDVETFLEELKAGEAVGPGDWAQITEALAAEEKQSFTDWSDLDRSRLYEALAKLRTYGYFVSIPAALQQEPSGADARRSWRRARLILGYAMTATP